MSAPEHIVVTGSRMRTANFARQEELGDLKLYRIPEPVTVASMSQKQVAFLEKSAVPFEKIHRGSIGAPGTVVSLRLCDGRERTLTLARFY